MSRARAVPRNTEDGGRKRKDWTNEREELAQVRWEKGYVYTAGMRNAGLSLLAGRVERAARGSHGDRRVMITWRERDTVYMVRTSSFFDLGSSDPVPFFDRLEICKMESKINERKVKKTKVTSASGRGSRQWAIE
jgi:hypothetical protein